MSIIFGFASRITAKRRIPTCFAFYWPFIFLWGLKLSRKRLNFMSAIPIPIPFQDFVVNEDAVPADAREKLNPLLQECARLGFLPPLYHVIRTLGGESVTTSANCRHSNGETIVRLMHTR